MMSIKELFKPPFIKSKGKIDGISVQMKKSHKHRGNRKEPVRLLNVNRDNLSWLFWDDDGAKVYNEIINWIEDALNEKYLRDFGEVEKNGCEGCQHWDTENLVCKDALTNPCPSTVVKHWILENDLLTCPKCKLTANIDGTNISNFLYCPRCRTNLSLQKEEK